MGRFPLPIYCPYSVPLAVLNPSPSDNAAKKANVHPHLPEDLEGIDLFDVRCPARLGRQEPGSL